MPKGLLFLRVRLQYLLCIERYEFLEAQYEEIRAVVLYVRMWPFKTGVRTLENLKVPFE